METLSPLRKAQDQAIIAACLVAAMKASGADAFRLSADAPAVPAAAADAFDRERLLREARSMRVEARAQCAAAREMRAASARIAAGLLWPSSGDAARG